MVRTDAQVGVDGSITSGTSQVLVLSVGDVKVSLWVSELFRETKINHVNLISTLADAHEEVVWLDVTVNEVARVDVLDTRYLRELDEIRTKEEREAKVPVGQQGARRS